MNRVEFEAARANIECLDTRRHCHLVEGVIRWARPKSVLEIGAYKGFMSATIGRALMESGEAAGIAPGRLTILDNFHDYRTNPQLLRSNLKACGVENYDLVKATSKSFTRGIIAQRWDMAVIDGDHTFDWAMADTQFAISNGAYILMFHDSDGFEGVRMVIRHLRSLPNWGVVELPFDSGYALAIEKFDTGSAGVPADQTYTI